MSYTHITPSERKYLQELLDDGTSLRKIANALGRNVSSISREIKRNRSKKNKKGQTNQYNYNQWRADNLAIERRRNHRRTALPKGSLVYEYVCEGLRHAWSPEEISFRLRKDHPDTIVGTSTIYRYLKRGELQGFSRKKHLRRHGKRMVNRNSNYNTIQPDRTVLDWPDSIKLRLEEGHLEGDTVFGKPGTGGILTFVDRLNLRLYSTRIYSKSAEETRKAIVRLLKNTGIKSITLDNGSEFAQFRQIEQELQIPVYFAEPHKPWQRGTNENTNGLLRFYFPKGIDFNSVSEEQLQKVVNELNHRPRKRLDWKSPSEF